MIVVVFNKPDFEYDVHSLLKEFFPQEDVQMYYSCSPDEVEGKNLACTHHEMTDDLELVAVISAAIAASENTSTDSFVVRSIKKVNRSKWQRA